MLVILMLGFLIGYYYYTSSNKILHICEKSSIFVVGCPIDLLNECYSHTHEGSRRNNKNNNTHQRQSELSMPDNEARLAMLRFHLV